MNVTITNADGNHATLANSFTFGTPPSIQSQPSNASVVLNSNAQFQVQASGQGALGYQWQLDGATLFNLGGISGAQTSVLSVSNAGSGDAGLYQVVITNAYGSITSYSAELTLLTRPTVSAPQSQAVGAGGTATFTVTAIGTTPLSFQWYQGTNLMIGATNPALSIPNVQPTNQGQYTVVVTNVVGLVTSSPAMLTVLAYCASAQTALTNYPAGSIIPFAAATYNCGTQAPQSNSAAVLWIYNSGTVRTIPFITDASGSATVNFTPLAGEVGLVQYAAALPGINNPAPQGSITLIGMSFTPASLRPMLAVGYPRPTRSRCPI